MVISNRPEIRNVCARIDCLRIVQQIRLPTRIDFEYECRRQRNSEVSHDLQKSCFFDNNQSQFMQPLHHNEIKYQNEEIPILCAMGAHRLQPEVEFSNFRRRSTAIIFTKHKTSLVLGRKVCFGKNQTQEKVSPESEGHKMVPRTGRIMSFCQKFDLITSKVIHFFTFQHESSFSSFLEMTT